MVMVRCDTWRLLDAISHKHLLMAALDQKLKLILLPENIRGDFPTSNLDRINSIYKCITVTLQYKHNIMFYIMLNCSI